jgi:uridine kinase
MKGAEHIKPVIIGVTGGTASGKTSLCMRIAERIGLDCAYIALDILKLSTLIQPMRSY